MSPVGNSQLTVV